jgi:hemoglobin
MTDAPNPFAPGASVGVREEMIRDLVHTFYARVRADETLGPIFNGIITDWDVHLDKLCDFWSSVVLMTGRYSGAPMQAHAALPGIGREHFERWLSLFADTALAVCTPAAAALFIDRSQRIARALETGMAVHRGQVSAPGQRSGTQSAE